MSIASAIAAEHGNKVRESWLKDLKEARESQDWAKIDALIARLEREHFSE